MNPDILGEQHAKFGEYYMQLIKQDNPLVYPSKIVYSNFEPKNSIPQPPERFVETLRSRGIKVRVKHYRWVAYDNEVFKARISKFERKNSVLQPRILQNGGETHVTVELSDGRTAQGIATCNTSDLYNKRVGVWIAAKRALASLKADKPVLTVSSAIV